MSVTVLFVNPVDSVLSPLLRSSGCVTTEHADTRPVQAEPRQNAHSAEGGSACGGAMEFDSERYELRSWKRWDALHWVVNPGPAFNELVLGQRVPKLILIDRRSTRPPAERQFVLCPNCETLHDGRLWCGRNSLAKQRSGRCAACRYLSSVGLIRGRSSPDAAPKPRLVRHDGLRRPLGVAPYCRPATQQVPGRARSQCRRRLRRRSSNTARSCRSGRSRCRHRSGSPPARR